jgi:hypothetical protein
VKYRASGPAQRLAERLRLGVGQHDVAAANSSRNSGMAAASASIARRGGYCDRVEAGSRLPRRPSVAVL